MIENDDDDDKVNNNNKLFFRLLINSRISLPFVEFDKSLGCINGEIWNCCSQFHGKMLNTSNNFFFGQQSLCQHTKLQTDVTTYPLSLLLTVAH
jgi:hypothetical protein